MKRWLFWGTGLLMLAGCEGRLAAPREPGFASGASVPTGLGPVDSDPADPPDSNPPVNEPSPHSDRPVFPCEEGAAMPDGLRRLSYVQYVASLQAFAATSMPPEQADSVVDSLPLQGLPLDVLSEDEDYPTMVQAVGQAHVDAYYETSVALGQVMGAELARGCDDPICVEETVENLARSAFRRPPLAAELSFLVDEVYASNPNAPAGFAAVVAVLTSSPDFLYRLEQGQATPQPDGSRRLTAHELASRLSYHFWQSPPDEALMAAADSGELLTEAGYQSQVDRLFRDPRTRAAMHAFFEAWLELEHVPDMDANVDRADFRAFAGEDLPDGSLSRDLVRDTLAFIDHVTWTEDGDLSRLFTDRSAIPPTEAVARLYGVEGAAGEHVELDPTERAGVLTRPAILAYNQAVTRPIMRGALIRVRLLCEDLSLPDNMDEIQIPEGSAGQTTRDKVVELTEVPGSTCENCHALLNPFGFALESYDALGRYRSEERFFDEEGSLTDTLPVNTQSQTLLDGQVSHFGDAVMMSEAMAESRQMQSCFARHYFRFSFGRREDVVRDGCVLESLRSRIAQGRPLAEVLRQVALEPAFQRLHEDQP